MSRPRTPLLAVDVVIELEDQPGRPIVLIERRHAPVGDSLPGGFVDVGESVEAAAVREAREETGLDRIEANRNSRVCDVTINVCANVHFDDGLLWNSFLVFSGEV